MIKNKKQLEIYSQSKFNNIPMVLVVRINNLVIDSFYVTGGKNLTKEVDEIVEDNYDEEVIIELLFS